MVGVIVTNVGTSCAPMRTSSPRQATTACAISKKLQGRDLVLPSRLASSFSCVSDALLTCFASSWQFYFFTPSHHSSSSSSFSSCLLGNVVSPTARRGAGAVVKYHATKYREPKVLRYSTDVDTGRKVNGFLSGSRHTSGATAGSSYPSHVPVSSWDFVANADPMRYVAPTSAYVHLPFCRRRCFYCDFPILAIGERTDKTKGHIDSTMSDYVEMVCKEIVKTAEENRRNDGGSNPPLETVFFGGGTPSLLPVPLLSRIMKELKSHFLVATNAEISMEMDPGTFDRDKLAGFLECGITRVSLGVQSFDEKLLQACGRAHGLQEVYDAVDAIHFNGVKNWSLDLIASLPNQKLAQWEHSLKEAVSLNPAHVSVYDLQIEEGTLFSRWFKAGQDPLPSDEISAEFYGTASCYLRDAGFQHYEVSNYAKPDFQCRHNLVYWENRPYHAFGLGSTSFVKNRRFTRPRKLKEYATYVQKLEESQYSSGTIHFPQVSLEEEAFDTLMLSLRLARGLNLREFEARFGSVFTFIVCHELVPFIETGLVEALDSERVAISSSLYIQAWKDHKLDVTKSHRSIIATEEFIHREDSTAEPCIDENIGGCTTSTTNNFLHIGSRSNRRAAFVRLTDPQGFLLSNEVISSLFAALPSGKRA